MKIDNGQASDADLLTIIAEKRLWLVRGGGKGQTFFDPANDLQSALTIAFERFTQGFIILSIVRTPADDVIIHADQIQRLWKHFRFTDADGAEYLKPSDDLAEHVGVRLKISKLGSDGNAAVYEGVLKGRGLVAGLSAAGSHMTPRWLLDADGTDIQFVHPSDGWIVARL